MMKRARSRWQRVRRVAGWVTLGVSALVVAVAIWVASVPFPADALAPDDLTSTVIVDRDGRLLREVLSEREGRGRWVGLDEISPHLVSAIIHAEDKRFGDHAGIDGVAILRSMWINASRGRATTGASTLTQQTVKLTLQRGEARTIGTKVMEAVWALRLEAALSKDEILEQYLNRAPFGNQLHGAAAASWMYFGKPARDLSLAEAALLAGIPQNPSHRNPYRNLAGARARQRDILAAMAERGAIDADTLARALTEPLHVLPKRGVVRAPHLTGAVAKQIEQLTPRPASIALTLDLEVQDAVSGILAHQRGTRFGTKPFQAAAVVLDTETSEVLAWVGSRDHDEAALLGANDGVTALRQPGSALKPFVYGAWLDAGGSAARILADLPTQFRTPDGVYRPQNYDRRFHGPVTVREALASSLNVPAVAVAQELGPKALLGTLRDAGFASLTASADHYGLGLALGNGEVRLVDLAGAYAALGRLGLYKPVTTGFNDVSGTKPRRIMSEASAFTILEMLTDDRARRMGFGEAGPLSLPYRVAAKTGTSSDFRDNWAVGVTPDFTVAVWVGNFDARPMNRVSGARGAAPLLRQVFQHLYPRAATADAVRWFTPPDNVTTLRLCRLSGARPGPDCAATFDEWVPIELASTIGPDQSHVRRRVDRDNGLLAGPGCADSEVVTRPFVVVPPTWRRWADQQGVAAAPTRWSPRCGPPSPVDESPVQLVHPLDGDRYRLDDRSDRASQAVTLEAASEDDAPITFFVNGVAVATVGRPFRTTWPLSPGEHDVAAGRSTPQAAVRIVVR